MSAITEEVSHLRLDEAEAFFAVTVHRDERGTPIPTVTVITPNLSKEHSAAMRAHLEAIVGTLRKAYAPVAK